MNTQSITACLDYLIQNKGRQLLIGTPLGIGKPNQLLNAIWEKAKSESDLSLEIFTALSLQVPRGKSILEKRFYSHLPNDFLLIILNCSTSTMSKKASCLPI
ncbi:MAG: hypothetical protein L3J52_09590 [Proteobacteria bacterium]|nr:hypothetical protein [Pseudomonadota bacterium]